MKSIYTILIFLLFGIQTILGQVQGVVTDEQGDHFGIG